MVYLGTNRLNDRWLGTNLLGDKKVFPGLLDTYPATAAYSAGRRLKSSQTYAMTIRRESDNAELNIGFDANGDTDQAAIEEFGGYNLLSYTEDLLRPEWGTAGSGSLTKVAGYSDKDGGDKAFLLTETNGTNPIALVQNCYSETVLAGETYTASFYYRNSSSVSNMIRIIGLGGIFEQSFVTLVSSSEWQKAECSISFTENNTEVRFDCFIAPLGSLEICFPQLEKSSSAKEYQKRATGGASDCFVPTLHDATGNGNDATQPVATEQPKIYDVATTSVVTENGKPALEFNGINTDLEFPNIAGNSYLDAWFVSRHDGTNSDRALYPYNRDPIPGGSAGFIFDKDSPLQPLNFYGSPEFYVNGVLSPQGTRGDIYTAIGDSYKLIEHRAADISTWTQFNVGGYPPSSFFFFEGTFQEIILFTDGSNPTNRTNIENNINNYYGIY